MGDHFVLLVDRLLTESTLEAALESRNLIKQPEPVTIDDTVIDVPLNKDTKGSLFPRKVVECRICQDEDFDSNMETPCSCSGSLKYAHRKCVQRWCNEKGDTMCEICHQQFKPGYTAPPPIFRFEGLAMNLRGNWQITRRDINNNPRIIAMVSTDHSLLDPDNEEYTASTSQSIVCCRSVAIIFMVLLIIRHTLPVIVSQAGSYSFPLFMLVMLRIVGIVLPICVILKAVISVIRRQQHQGNLSRSSSDEEASPLTLHQPHILTVQ